VQLPAAYVTEHVHLGYALTTHRAQGMTKDAGIPILDAATTRENAYVAATRGRDENVLFVVLDEGQDRDSVLSTIANNHSHETSAHEALSAEYERINDPLTLADQYRYVTEEANRIRMAALARSVLGDGAETFVATESWGAVATNLAKAEHDGWDPAHLLNRAATERDFDGAEDKSAVLSWRIEAIVEKAPEVLAAAGARPLAHLTDKQLAALKNDVAAIGENRAASYTAAAAVHGPHPADHWTNRRHGGLTDAELERRIFTSRFTARETESINNPALARRNQYRLRALVEEQKIRTEQARAGKNSTEAAARGPRSQYAPTAPGVAAERNRSLNHQVIAARVRAEERLRAITPGTPVQEEKIDRLPDWLAPARTVTSEYLPQEWREELLARREVLTARMDERGHMIAAEPPVWAQQLGPVPADPAAAQQWRDTAGELELFRARYNVPDTEQVPVPENLRTNDIGQDLHDRAVTVSKRARALKDHATEAEKLTAAAEALDRAKDTHAPASPAQDATDKGRAMNAQEPTAVTPAQKDKPRLRTKLERMVAEQQAKNAPTRKPTEQATETEAQRQARLASERAVREQQRSADEVRGPGIGL
jgi:hypothetical protein